MRPKEVKPPEPKKTSEEKAKAYLNELEGVYGRKNKDGIKITKTKSVKVRRYPSGTKDHYISNI
jgi:hypothetical protein